ncbi:HalX domain-containing protein [Natronorubrum aibiense]|uniref:Response regulator n=1 Tax=Natronorubrum aibiense TaxID=348826 RepID=A0A5P9P5R3_9EURY|nr:HalX domain-containing protein [Natronorubrum aibiense]QFU83505.1 response regulator [Natronorubrum aibiense]
MTTETPSVLIVEDEPDLARLYAAWLEGSYDVETVSTGERALDAIDETIDIVLLDRRMPGLSGETVLSTVRERDLACRVAMVSAVEPDFDVIGMGFDDYLVKPASKDELRRIVEHLVLRTSYDEQLQEYFSLASTKAVLDAETTEAERKSSDEYAQLQDRLALCRVRLDETMTELLEQGGYRRLYQDLASESIS